MKPASRRVRTPRLRRWRAARPGRRGLALAGLALLLGAVLVASRWVAPLLAWLLTLAPLLDRDPLAGALAFVALSAASAVVAFFSSAVLVPAAVSAWGATTTLGLLWLGWWLGGGLTYLLGRGLAPADRGPRTAAPDAAPTPAVSPSRLHQRVSRLAARLPPGLDFPLVLALQLALPSELPGYLCGVLRVHARVYFTALALAELPYAAATVLVGQGLVDGRWWLMLAGAVLLALVVVLATARVRRAGIRARDAGR